MVAVIATPVLSIRFIRINVDAGEAGTALPGGGVCARAIWMYGPGRAFRRIIGDPNIALAKHALSFYLVFHLSLSTKEFDAVRTKPDATEVCMSADCRLDLSRAFLALAHVYRRRLHLLSKDR